MHAWLRRQHLHVMAGRNHAKGSLWSSCKLFLGPEWLRDGYAAMMAKTEYPSHLPCLLPQMDRTEFNVLTTHSKKLRRGKIQEQNTNATHWGASCQICQLSEQKVLQCLQADLHKLFLHTSDHRNILSYCGFANLRCVLMFRFPGVLWPTNRSNLLYQVAGYCFSIWPFANFLQKTNYCRWKQSMKLNLAENAQCFEPTAGLILISAHFGSCRVFLLSHRTPTPKDNVQGQPVKFLVVAAEADDCTEFCWVLAIRNHSGKMHPDHNGCQVFSEILALGRHHCVQGSAIF